MSYSSSDAATRLARVREAIDKVLSSQEYGSGQLKNRRAELKELRAMERELQLEVDAASGGFTLGQLDPPT